MPAGRGRKGEAPPRKRKKRCQPTTHVHRNGTTSRNSRPIPQPADRETQPFSAPAAEALHIQTASHVNAMQQNVPQSVNPPSQSTAYHPPQPNFRPPYPCPAPNTFILYILHFCPPLTSVCFGCGNSLKPSGIICNPPGDLVIVSFMQRQYFHEGETRTRSGNVYFHCFTRCVRIRQPAFDPPRHCMVPDAIRSQLTPVHCQYVEQHLGLLL